MNLRTVLYTLFGIAAACLAVYMATTLQAGPGSDGAALIYAQRHTPLLWVIDVGAAGLAVGLWWVAVMSGHFKKFVDHQAVQHQEQLDEMIERTLDIETVNDRYTEEIERLEAEIGRRFRELTDRIASVEKAGDLRHNVLELETRRIAEHSFRDLESRLDVNSGQVEAANITLQIHRGELKRLRQQVRDLEIRLPPQYARRILTSMAPEPQPARDAAEVSPGVARDAGSAAPSEASAAADAAETRSASEAGAADPPQARAADIAEARSLAQGAAEASPAQPPQASGSDAADAASARAPEVVAQAAKGRTGRKGATVAAAAENRVTRSATGANKAETAGASQLHGGSEAGSASPDGALEPAAAAPPGSASPVLPDIPARGPAAVRAGAEIGQASDAPPEPGSATLEGATPAYPAAPPTPGTPAPGKERRRLPWLARVGGETERRRDWKEASAETDETIDRLFRAEDSEEPRAADARADARAANTPRSSAAIPPSAAERASVGQPSDDGPTTLPPYADQAMQGAAVAPDSNGYEHSHASPSAAPDPAPIGRHAIDTAMVSANDGPAHGAADATHADVAANDAPAHRAPATEPAGPDPTAPASNGSNGSGGQGGQDRPKGRKSWRSRQGSVE